MHTRMSKQSNKHYALDSADSNACHRISIHLNEERMDRMKNKMHLLKNLALASILVTAPLQAMATSQVLATVGTLQVSSDDLDAAMASSPFATQMTSMDEDDQAGLRGDMLRRLVAARLLTLEARKLGLDKTEAYQKEMENFRLGLLYRFYMDKLRERIVVPADTLAAMKKQFKGDQEGMTAAKAAYVNWTVPDPEAGHPAKHAEKRPDQIV